MRLEIAEKTKKYTDQVKEVQKVVKKKARRVLFWTV
jgi:hypothetical protein